MKHLKLLFFFVLTNLSVFASPGWQEIQSTVKEQFHSRMDRVGVITKIVKRDEGSTELNREIYPNRYEFSQGVWVYYEGDLPGEIRRQKMSVYFFREINLEQWNFDALGTPVSGKTNEVVEPPLKTPSIPAAPSEEQIRKQLEAYLKQKYGQEEGVTEFNFEKLTFNKNLEYHKDPKGYRDVNYEGNITADFNMLVEDNRYARTFKHIYTCTGTLNLQATKVPASLWLESLSVETWQLTFKHEIQGTVEKIEERRPVPEIEKLEKIVKNEFLNKAKKIESSSKKLTIGKIEVIRNDESFPGYGGEFSHISLFKINYEEAVKYGTKVKKSQKHFQLQLMLHTNEGIWDYDKYKANFR